MITLIKTKTLNELKEAKRKYDLLTSTQIHKDRLLMKLAVLKQIQEMVEKRIKKVE